ncbi:MAG: NADH-quinone oxidoreductase subunit C [Propionibacteriaceae bacterium]|jgi:NADH-quinone oxidoreductase subunit C|nr:NADH-quinone oxidoreductase subunit C [Propionibacteriaceae bacterium]
MTTPTTGAAATTPEVAAPDPTTPDTATPDTAAPAARPGMWGTGPGDVSGFGGQRRPLWRQQASPRPYGGWFDAAVDRLAELVEGLDPAGAGVAQGELTVQVPKQLLLAVARAARDDPGLRFEVCVSVSGVHYPDDPGRELHSVYHLLSLTHNRRLRLEVAVPLDDARIPSVTPVYPMADWHERETWDMFGIEYTGHPGLTRILMPDDWVGHQGRKDYPLGGVPIEFKGAQTPPPDQRRSY